jgi:hypothetical protein
MRFSTVLLSVAAFAAAVLAAENPIIKPDGKEPILAGHTFTIEWKPTTEGTITLTLRQGPSTNLNTLGVIADKVPNSGTYEWTPDASLPSGDNYAIMITSANGDVNYTPLLTITGTSSKAVSSSHPSKTAAASKSGSATTVSASMTKSHSASMTSAPHSTAHHNSTIYTSTRTSSNSTTSSTQSGSKTSTTLHTGSSSSTPSAAPASGAVGMIRSPLALVGCLGGAIVYLN